MISAKQALKYFNKYVSMLVPKLADTKTTLKISLHERDTEYDYKGMCQPEDNYKTMNIEIYYGPHKDIRDFVGTIYHELLHSRMRAIRPLISKNRRKEYDELEEDLVRDLEKIYISMLGKKL